jgi:hypothetical protein
MLPAQDEKRQNLQDSVISDSLDVYSESKLVGSIGDLRRRLDVVKLDEVAVADQQIKRIVEQLKQFEYVLGILRAVRHCQSQANLAAQDNTQALDRIRLEVLSRPSHSNPLLGLAKLINLREVENPESEPFTQSDQAVKTTLSAGSALALNAMVSKIEFTIPSPAGFEPASTCGEQAACAKELTANDELPPISAAGAAAASSPAPVAHANGTLNDGPEPAAEEPSDSNRAAQQVAVDNLRAADLVPTQGIETEM